MGGPSFFYEDEVFRVGKHGDLEFGMVTENWEMYSSDDEDSHDPDKVLPGQVAVSWHPKGKDEVLQESKVKLSDRSLMPGDVVRRLIAGKDTQRGYCRNVRVLAAVQVIGSKKVIPSVLASDLHPVQKLQPEVAVYLDSWIGVIRDIRHKLSLRFADNSQCTIDSYGILDNFEDVRRGSEGFGSGEVFYPGQKLRGPFRFIRDGEWTHMSEDMKRSKDRKMVTTVVTHIEPTSINVTWQWQTPQGAGEKAESLRAPPPDLIVQADLDRVKILNLFEYCTVQLGDISYFTPGNKESLIDKQEWKKNATAQILRGNDTLPTSVPSQTAIKPDVNNEQGFDTQNEGKSEEDNKRMTDIKEGVTKFSQMVTDKICKKAPKLSTRSLRKRKLKKAKPQTSQLNLVPGTQVVVETLHTQSVVDVVWQDGVIEEGMLSVDLYPIHHLDDHEFFPGDFITRADSTDFRKYGVIQNMDHNGRVALVKWFEAYTFDGEQRPKELDVTEMSVYDIKDHPDFRFRPGTIVIRVANSLPDQAAAGQILDNYPDGMVRVWWANGVTNSCWPQDLFRLGDYDSDEGEIWDDGQISDGEDEDANSDSSWETEIEEEIPDADTSNQRYINIGNHIEHIQKSLVGIRAMLISSTPAEQTTPTSPLNLNSPSIDKRVIVKKLLQIYKDCQYLDKMMSTKFFDVEFLKEWLKKLEGTFKSSRISDQLKRLFELPTELSDKIGEASEIKSLPEEKPIEGFDDGSQEIQIEFLSELCTVILNKLLLAHDDFEKRFGSKKNDELPELVEVDETVLEKVEEPGEFNKLKEATNDKESRKEEEQFDKTEKEEILKEIKVKGHNFSLVECVPITHRFRLSTQPQNMRVFLKGVQKEIALLREYLPEGILVKGYEDRMDLFSVMICGPEKTPYEDGIFLFDIQLPPAYPSAPPLVHYVSFCPDRLNPNLYECGKVCVSLLGTWTGKGTEVWTSSSSLLQVLVSIQGLILVQEPYFNEAGYERQRGSQQGEENSRMYNEMVLIKLVQSMSRMLNNLHAPFEKEIVLHMQVHGSRLVTRCNAWLTLSEQIQSEPTNDDLAKEGPAFSLLPVSKGFSITLKSTLGNFAKLCSGQNMPEGS